MKVFISLFLICIIDCCISQVNADRILGEWLFEKKDTRIGIYKTGTKYFGRSFGEQGRLPKMSTTLTHLLEKGI